MPKRKSLQKEKLERRNHRIKNGQPLFFHKKIETKCIKNKNANALQATMEIALERISNCVNGELDLSRLGLTELPPIPEGITSLRCSHNPLTSLPRLPSTLEMLYCSYNQLTSLPELPPSLEYLQCSNNELTGLPELPPSLYTLYCNINRLSSLPELPPSLRILRCYNNELTSLPTLPPIMVSINCYCNPLTTLPTLPLQLEELTCFTCRLTSLPTLPTNLRRLNCLGNPLETLPELPSTLDVLKYELPIHYEMDWEIQEEIQHGGQMIQDGMWPDMVAAVNGMIVRAAAYANQESKTRCMERCSLYKEEIMMTVWHPSRVAPLIEMGIDLESVM